MERDRRGVHGGIKRARGRLYIKDEARPRAILGRARRIGRRARFGCNRGGREGKETEAFEGGLERGDGMVEGRDRIFNGRG